MGSLLITYVGFCYRQCSTCAFETVLGENCNSKSLREVALTSSSPEVYECVWLTIGKAGTGFERVLQASASASPFRSATIKVRLGTQQQ